jgi:hypothetical protein
MMFVFFYLEIATKKEKPIYEQFFVKNEQKNKAYMK